MNYFDKSRFIFGIFENNFQEAVNMLFLSGFYILLIIRLLQTLCKFITFLSNFFSIITW